MTVLGIVLAGGRSTRLGGGVKGMLDLGGQPMIGRVIARLAPQVGAVAINANTDPKVFAAFGLPVMPDPVGGNPGPLAGVLAGMDYARATGSSLVVTVAADTPFFPADLVGRLVEASRQTGLPVVMAAHRESQGPIWREPAFALWPSNLADGLRQALAEGVRKVTDWADAQGCAVAEFPATGPDPFFNVNTPDDLAAARRMFEGKTG